MMPLSLGGLKYVLFLLLLLVYSHEIQDFQFVFMIFADFFAQANSRNACVKIALVW